MPEHVRALGVHFLHPLVVGRFRRRSRKRVIDESLALVSLIIRIETLLVTDRAIEPLADVSAARRAAPVRWIDDHPVVKFSVEIPKRVVKLGRQLVGISAEQIRTAGG